MATIEFSDAQHVDDLEPILERYRPISLLSVGVRKPITMAEVVNVSVTGKHGSHRVQLLRYFTASLDGPVVDDDVILTQLLRREPTPFDKAILATFGHDLADAEERLALSDYHYRFSQPQERNRHDQRK